jgi:hypothetical protein
VKGTGLVLLVLVAVAVPRLAASAVVVAEPTGDADPAFLAELKASLETVSAEAPTELNGELRASATVKDDGVELVVEFVPNDGQAPITETRVASMASALAQARAMGKSVCRLIVVPHFREPSAVTPALVREVQSEAYATVPEKYDRRRALLASGIPTYSMMAIGLVLMCLAPATSNTSELVVPSFILGPIVAGLGVIVGPSLGYFYIGRVGRGLAMGGIRLALSVAALWMILEHELAQPGWDACNSFEEDSEIDACLSKEEYPALLPIGIIAASLAAVLAVVDATLVGRAADRANAEWRERQKPMIQVAPVAWSGGRGDTTYGLALQGTF